MPPRALKSVFFEAPTIRFFTVWWKTMRLLFAMLSGIFITLVANSVSAQQHDLSDCEAELKAIVGAGKGAAKRVDENFQNIVLCIQELLPIVRQSVSGDDLKSTTSSTKSLADEAKQTAESAAMAAKTAEELSRSSELASKDTAKLADENRVAIDMLLNGNQGILAQIQAQAICTAISGVAGQVTAIRRSCDATTVSCAVLCSRLESRSCFESLHIYNNEAANADSTVGFVSHRYNDCNPTGCGPNYCCCRK